MKTKLDFSFCEICKSPVKKVSYDSPVYCEKCIERMEKEGLTARQLKKEIELEQTLKKK